MEICGDNRFEIIARAKAHLLDATNIDTSEDEMKVLDDILFRCWQMGWLDRLEIPVQQSERKKGMWTYIGDSEWKCSNCGDVIDIIGYDYCPNCGSYNGGEQDEAD